MAWGVETVKTTIAVTISREGSIEVGELSVYCFTNSLGEEVRVESFQLVDIPGPVWPCEKLRPQRDPRRHRFVDAKTTMAQRPGLFSFRIAIHS